MTLDLNVTGAIIQLAGDCVMWVARVTQKDSSHGSYNFRDPKIKDHFPGTDGRRPYFTSNKPHHPQVVCLKYTSFEVDSETRVRGEASRRMF